MNKKCKCSKEKNDKAWEKYKSDIKCKRCPNQIDPKNKFTDDLCNRCYYSDESQVRQTFLGDDEPVYISKHIIKYIVVGLLAVAGLVFWLIG